MQQSLSQLKLFQQQDVGMQLPKIADSYRSQTQLRMPLKTNLVKRHQYESKLSLLNKPSIED